MAKSASTSTAKKAASKVSGTGKKKAAKRSSAKKKSSKKATKKKASKKKVAKKKAAKKSGAKTRASSSKSTPTAHGKSLVIVESPAKAKTINKYLGSEFVVRASVGHIRDLPNRAPKGTKQPVPGVDLENGFTPTYEILSEKTKTVSELKSEASVAKEIWFATDLDREGEAIAWHLSDVFDIEPEKVRRVVFNAITREEIQRAFNEPRGLNMDVVHAQQARRILDRIVGYMASPLLWKKVARGLSAGRVQSVAVRMVVERERAIAAFVPDENWRFIVRLCADPGQASPLSKAWEEFLATRDAKNKGPTLKLQNEWMSERGGLRCELHEYKGKRFSLTCSADDPKDLSAQAVQIAKDCGLIDVSASVEEDPEGKGPARYRRSVSGKLDPAVRYEVANIETRETSSRPSAPLITSSLQIAASNQLSFSAQRTMRLAQDLYEGVSLKGKGEVGLITYMRTDSTHLSAEAIGAIRGYISDRYGEKYLPAKPNVFSSSNKSAQEAHEAIRPTDVDLHPDDVARLLSGPRAEEHAKLYRLIWSATVGCQMTPARWKATNVSFRRADQDSGAVVRASGRILAFDGFYRAVGVPRASDSQTLPALEKGDKYGAFSVRPEQRFSSPPPRFAEASLVKALETEGIGRPSTYASIIDVIQRRNYVEQVDRRFHATDLGEVVTDKLIEAFPSLMSIGYTRDMEGQLDAVESNDVNWVSMLETFYQPFSTALEAAHEELTHAKAEIQPAIFACPTCGARTCYRFGKNGRFLSCSAYPDCDYAAPIDRSGRPLLPERVDIVCPEDGSAMEVRKGRFGPFIASVNYPETNYKLDVDRKGLLKYPAIPPYLVEEHECPKCESALNLRRGKRGPWLGCSTFPKCRGRLAWKSLEEDEQARLEKLLEAHEKENPRPAILRQDSSVIPEGTPIADLVIPGGLAELPVHAEAKKEIEASQAEEASAATA